MGGKSLTRALRHREQVACLRKDSRGGWSRRILSYLTILVIQEGKRVTWVLDHEHLILGLGLRQGLNL